MPRDKNIFTLNPTKLDASRSVFNKNSQVKTSFNLGEIIPLKFYEVLPGDTISLDLSNVIRMGTPIAPIMDNIHMDLYAFFVPNRTIWSHWEQFCGANDTTAWTQTNEYEIPMTKAASGASDTVIGSVGDYFGLPYEYLLHAKDGELIGDGVSELPLRSYVKIYNEWFRDENSIDPVLFTIGDEQNATISYLMRPFKASRFHDLFSSCLPAPQKGASVMLPLGETAPVITGPVDQFSKQGQLPLAWADTGTGNLVQAKFGIGTTGVAGPGASDAGTQAYSTSTSTVYGSIVPDNLVADLSRATAATINQIRYAFQLQKLLEKDARGGTRYVELLKSHFGVTSSDARLQRAEYLCGKRFRINVDQVLSHAETISEDQSSGEITTLNPLGNTGAYSLTGGVNSMFTKSFTEHGIVMILGVARQDHTYSQGLEKYWTKKNRFDFYYPVLANIGEVPVKKQEIKFSNSATDNDVFGYQEAWYDYRFEPSRCTGFMNPAASNSLNYWTLGDVYTEVPALNKQFLEETPDNLDRALAVGSQLTHQFIGDFYFKAKFSRIMPVYSIPGLIDHH